VVTVVYHRDGWGRDAPSQPPPGAAFRMTGRRVVQRMTLTWFRAPRPTVVRPLALNTPGENGSVSFAASPPG
jgi:hypothetical protein